MSSVSANGAVFHGPVASSSTAVARAASTRARTRDERCRVARADKAREVTARARAVGVVVVFGGIVARSVRVSPRARRRSSWTHARRRDSFFTEERPRSVNRRRARRRGMKEPTARTIWSYRDEFQSWKNYDSTSGLRYTRETIDAVRFNAFRCDSSRRDATRSRARWTRDD